MVKPKSLQKPYIPDSMWIGNDPPGIMTQKVCGWFSSTTGSEVIPNLIFRWFGVRDRTSYYAVSSMKGKYNGSDYDKLIFMVDAPRLDRVDKGSWQVDVDLLDIMRGCDLVVVFYDPAGVVFEDYVPRIGNTTRYVRAQRPNKLVSDVGCTNEFKTYDEIRQRLTSEVVGNLLK